MVAAGHEYLASKRAKVNRFIWPTGMYKNHRTLQMLTALFFFIAICAFANTSLEQYVYQNKEEEKIIALLIHYQEARKNFDLESYLGCLHDRGTYHYASRVMVSKQKLSELLPEFWIQLNKGDRAFFPMCRENISGNYFVGFQLVNPKIKIDRNTASATVVYVNAGWRQRHYIFLVK